MTLDGFVERLALGLIPPGAAGAKVEVHRDHDRLGRTDLGQARLQEAQTALRIPHCACLGACLDAVAGIQVDVDEVYTLPVPSGVQGVGGKLRDKTSGEHPAITFAQTLADRTGGTAVMIARQGEGRVLRGRRTLPRQHPVKILPLLRITDLSEVACDDHAERTRDGALPFHRLSDRALGGPRCTGDFGEHLERLRDVGIEGVGTKRRGGLAVIHPHVHVRDQVKGQITGRLGAGGESEQQQGKDKR